MRFRSRVLALFLLSVVLLGTDAPSGDARERAKAAAVTPLAGTAGGDTCATATVISTLPFNDSGDTTAASDQHLFLNTTCAGGGQITREGPDLVYSFTVATGSSLTFTLTPDPSFDATLYIVGTCGNGSTCVQERDTGIEGETETIGPRTFNPGTYYLYVDSIYPADDKLGQGPYTLQVTGDFGTPNNTSFYTLTPCRVLDTRDASGAPALIAGATRTFTIAGQGPGQCQVPLTAKSVSINVTVTQPTSLGYLTLFPGGTAAPLASTINFSAEQTRANNAIVPLGANGTMSVLDGQSTGTTDFILDVNGYFQ